MTISQSHCQATGHSFHPLKIKYTNGTDDGGLNYIVCDVCYLVTNLFYKGRHTPTERNLE